MVRSTALVGAIAALVVSVTGIATASAKGGKNQGTCPGAYVIAVDAASRQQASDAVLCLINRERTSRGLPAVRPVPQLVHAATGHSADMVANKYFSHIDGSGDSVQQRADRAGYHWLAVGETLSWGDAKRSTPFVLVNNFLNSAEHRTIMLDGRYRDAGVGLVLGSPQANVRGTAATLTVVFGSR
jgi:uncharacterized protein YkwD